MVRLSQSNPYAVIKKILDRLILKIMLLLNIFKNKRVIRLSTHLYLIIYIYVILSQYQKNLIKNYTLLEI